MIYKMPGKESGFGDCVYPWIVSHHTKEHVWYATPRCVIGLLAGRIPGEAGILSTSSLRPIEVQKAWGLLLCASEAELSVFAIARSSVARCRQASVMF